jgi:uncharacterized membrane protein
MEFGNGKEHNNEQLAPLPSAAYQGMKQNISEDERVGSILGGGLVTWLGLLRGGFWGGLLASGGGYLLYRGVTGYCPLNKMAGKNTSNRNEADDVIEISREVTIERPVQEVFAYWRAFENLPRFMTHLESVRQIDGKNSEWVAVIPGGVGKITWQAEIVQEEVNALIVYRSLPGADVDNSGTIRFTQMGNGGTVVHSTLSYRPPAAGAGVLLSKLLNPLFSKMVRNDMSRFKDVMEQGIPTSMAGM